ncbi:MAG: hypothetical protein AAGM22_22320, partial [Acidobacteriota bacterium]
PPMRTIALLSAFFLFLLSATPVSADDYFQVWSQLSIPLVQWDLQALSLYEKGVSAMTLRTSRASWSGPSWSSAIYSPMRTRANKRRIHALSATSYGVSQPERVFQRFSVLRRSVKVLQGFAMVKSIGHHG